MASFKDFLFAYPLEVVLCAVLVITVLVIAYCLLVVRPREVISYIRSFGTDESRVLLKTDQEWRGKDMEVKYLEGLRNNLIEVEEKVSNGWRRALIVHRSRGLKRLKRIECSDLIKIREDLTLRVDRLWDGKIYAEQEKCKVALERLNRENDPDEKSQIEQVLRDLSEAERLAKKRVEVSANRAKWQEDQEVHDIWRESRIRTSFEGVHTIHAAIKMREKLKEQFKADTSLSEPELRKLFTQVDAAAKAVEDDSKIESKKNRKKNVNIYEDD